MGAGSSLSPDGCLEGLEPDSEHHQYKVTILKKRQRHWREISGKLEICGELQIKIHSIHFPKFSKQKR